MSSITLNQAAELLLKQDNIVILSHKNPDGDTVGSAYALLAALIKLGKKACVFCGDAIPDKYSYFTDKIPNTPLKSEDYVVAVDIADENLLGSLFEKYHNKINLSIDHHKTNKQFAEYTYVNSDAAANTENIYELINILDVKIDADIASALYTGISTDTGCFRYSNTTSNTHLVAAKLMEFNFDRAAIDRLMFETKTKAKLQLEKVALKNLRLYFDGRCAVTSVKLKDISKAGGTLDDFEGIASIPRTIKGVMLGITLKEQKNGSVKVSMRSIEPVDAAAICAGFGGGGHPRAAGCEICGSINKAKRLVLLKVQDYLLQQKL